MSQVTEGAFDKAAQEMEDRLNALAEKVASSTINRKSINDSDGQTPDPVSKGAIASVSVENNGSCDPLSQEKAHEQASFQHVLSTPSAEAAVSNVCMTLRPGEDCMVGNQKARDVINNNVSTTLHPGENQMAHDVTHQVWPAMVEPSAKIDPNFIGEIKGMDCAYYVTLRMPDGAKPSDDEPRSTRSKANLPGTAKDYEISRKPVVRKKPDAPTSEADAEFQAAFETQRAGVSRSPPSAGTARQDLLSSQGNADPTVVATPSTVFLTPLYPIPNGETHQQEFVGQQNTDLSQLAESTQSTPKMSTAIQGDPPRRSDVFNNITEIDESLDGTVMIEDQETLIGNQGLENIRATQDAILPQNISNLPGGANQKPIPVNGTFSSPYSISGLLERARQRQEQTDLLKLQNETSEESLKRIRLEKERAKLAYDTELESHRKAIDLLESTVRQDKRKHEEKVRRLEAVRLQQEELLSHRENELEESQKQVIHLASQVVYQSTPQEAGHQANDFPSRQVTFSGCVNEVSDAGRIEVGDSHTSQASGLPPILRKPSTGTSKQRDRSSSRNTRKGRSEKKKKPSRHSSSDSDSESCDRDKRKRSRRSHSRKRRDSSTSSSSSESSSSSSRSSSSSSSRSRARSPERTFSSEGWNREDDWRRLEFQQKKKMTKAEFLKDACPEFEPGHDVRVFIKRFKDWEREMREVYPRSAIMLKLQSKLCGAAYDWSTSQDDFVDLTVDRALKKLKRAFPPPTQIQLEMELSSFTFKPNHDPNRFWNDLQKRMRSINVKMSDHEECTIATNALKGDPNAHAYVVTRNPRKLKDVHKHFMKFVAGRDCVRRSRGEEPLYKVRSASTYKRKGQNANHVAEVEEESHRVNNQVLDNSAVGFDPTLQAMESPSSNRKRDENRSRERSKSGNRENAWKDKSNNRSNSKSSQQGFEQKSVGRTAPQKSTSSSCRCQGKIRWFHYEQYCPIKMYQLVTYSKDAAKAVDQWTSFIQKLGHNNDVKPPQDIIEKVYEMGANQSRGKNSNGQTSQQSLKA